MTMTAVARGNTLHPLRASRLTVRLVERDGIVRRFVRCPACGEMTQVKRHELVAHNAPGKPRCANSRRALVNDLDEADWASAFARTAEHVVRSRASRPQFYKPAPPTATPVAHLARPRTAHPARTAGHAPDTLAQLDRAAKAAAKSKPKAKAR